MNITNERGVAMREITKLFCKPSQCVEINGIEVWKNREPAEWHIKFPPLGGSPLLSCPDGNCPSSMHSLENELFLDPHCLLIFSKLREGMKVLIYMKHRKTEYVCFFTFKGICESINYLQIYSKELSKDGEIFTPYRKKPRDGFGLSIWWHSVKYIAIVDSKEKPFGKKGGLDCFKEELLRLAKINKEDLENALDHLKSLNSITSQKPLLKPADYLSRHVMEALEKGEYPEALDSEMTEAFASSLAYLFVFLSNRDKFGEFVKIVGDKSFFESPVFCEALTKMSEWYLKCALTQQKEVEKWWKEWDRYFKVGLFPIFSTQQ